MSAPIFLPTYLRVSPQRAPRTDISSDWTMAKVRVFFSAAAAGWIKPAASTIAESVPKNRLCRFIVAPPVRFALPSRGLAGVEAATTAENAS